MTAIISFNDLERSRMRGVQVDALDNHWRFILPSVGGARGVITAYAAPPRTHADDSLDADTASRPATERLFRATHRAYRGAARALRAFDQWGSTVGAAAADKKFSPDGRREVLLESSRTALTALAPVYRELDALRVPLAQRRAKLYTPSEPSVADALVDIEARGLYRSRTGPDRLQLAASVTEPRHARLLLALMRSPEPWEGDESRMIGSAWEERVAREHPAETSALRDEEAATEWSTGLSRFVAGLVTTPALNAPSIFDRIELHQMLAPLGAEGLIGFQSHESDAFTQRAQVAA